MTRAAGVALRPVEEADLPALYMHQDDPIANEMAVFAARPQPEFMAHWMRILADEAAYARAIVVDDEVVGTIMCWFEGDDRKVGYWLGRAYWGQGYATRALQLLLEEITDRPLIAHVADTNIGSRRVLEHVGFRRVGGDEVDGVRESTYRLG
jgi:RimJ/RimL family protein N-acetyltransferase